jgi:hypothetical protein
MMKKAGWLAEGLPFSVGSKCEQLEADQRAHGVDYQIPVVIPDSVSAD